MSLDSHGPLLHDEAERLIECLVEFDIDQVGSVEWMKQHEVLSRLNLAAHAAVMSKSENFVLDTLVTFDKVSCIIHELIVAEVWRTHVLPKMLPSMTAKASLRAYFCAYQEACLINLLECIMCVCSLFCCSCECYVFCGTKYVTIYLSMIAKDIGNNKTQHEHCRVTGVQDIVAWRVNSASLLTGGQDIAA